MLEFRVLALGSFLGIATFLCALVVVRTMVPRANFTPLDWPGISPGKSGAMIDSSSAF